jgi:RNA polymerase sigma-70 factor (ECF subfamily)
LKQAKNICVYTNSVNNKISDEKLASLSLVDANNFAEIVDRYERKLDAYICRRSVLTKQDREDLLQDIFIKVYISLNDFDRSLVFSSWVYRIAHNTLISWHRKHKRRLQTDSTLDSFEIAAWTASDDMIEPKQIDQQQKEAASRAFLELPENYKEIMRLRFYEELSYEQISDILQIPKGTVSIRISRGKKKLQDLFNIIYVI